MIVLEPDDDADKAIARHQQERPDETLFIVWIVDPVMPPSVDYHGHARRLDWRRAVQRVRGGQ